MKYEIDININGSEQDISGVSYAETATAPQESSSQSGSTSNISMKSVASFVASQTIQPIISNVKSQLSTQIGLITGSTELQERINFGLSLVERTTSVIGVASAGAAIGSAIPGVGTAVGFVAGAVLGVVSQVIDYAFDKRELDTRSMLENYQLQQLRERSGVQFNRSRSYK